MKYDDLKKQIEASNKKEEARIRAIRKKREEKQAIKTAGGGHELARKLLQPMANNDSDTDFAFGHNATDDESEASASDCMGRVECQRCKKFHGYCREIEEKVKMLPTGDNNESSRNRSRTGGLNFINTQDLSTTPTEAKILMVKYTEKGKAGPSITLKMAFKGEIRFLWVPARKSDPRYSAMISAFGPDENNWVDQRIHLSLEKDDFSENFKQTISIPTAKRK